ISKSFESVLKGDEKGLSGLEKSCPSGKEVIDNNIEFAIKSGINGTPTIVFPNKGLKVIGILPSEKLDKLIDIIYGN
ncbi:MAG: DsbC family protein, partial [Calditerrivibrio sp.]